METFTLNLTEDQIERVLGALSALAFENDQQNNPVEAEKTREVSKIIRRLFLAQV